MVSPSLYPTGIIVISRREQSQRRRRARSFRSFTLVLKYLGFMNALAGCINYTIFRVTVERRRKRDAKKQSVRNIMSRRLFPRAQNTTGKAHKLRDERKRGERRSRPLGCHIEYSWNKLSRSMLAHACKTNVF